MNDVKFKAAKESDLGKMLEIYNYYIRTTTANFYHHELSEDEFRKVIFIGHKKYRTFLIYSARQFVGFCFLTQYKNKEAFDRTAEIGVYIKSDSTSKGFGCSVVAFLEKQAVDSQIRVIIASISGENSASIGLFKKMGYKKCAHYKAVGEKFGRFLDAVAFQKILLKK